MTHQNNFDFLRLAAAATVLISHSFAMWSGVPDPLQLRTGITMGSVAVYVFFLTSGFLVAQSWTNDPDSVRFLLRRSLRILPVLYLHIVVSLLISGLLLMTLSATDFWSSRGTWDVLKGFGVFWLSGTIPGVFPNGPYPLAFNGPLWTIQYEVACYIVLLIVGAADFACRRNATAVILFIVLLCNAVVTATPKPYAQYHFIHLKLPEFLQLFAFFFSGVAFYAWRGSIAWSRTAAVLLLPCLYCATAHPFFWFLFPVALTFSVLSLSLTPVGGISNIGRFGDYSYGLYLYAWPCQQFVREYLDPNASLTAFIVLSFALTSVLAAASWHLVEKVALRYKPRSLPRLKRGHDSSDLAPEEGHALERCPA